MWGEGGGPGTIYRLNAENGYAPEIFAEIELDGRPNSGPALGNIAFDPWNWQLFVSDLETGMIHRLALGDGEDLGQYDHGVDGRARFVDAATGESATLPLIAFVPESAAQVDDCPAGEFAGHPECWNYADFRRRVWGLGVRLDAASGDVRLYYAVWSNEGFENPDHDPADQDEIRNSVWSIRIDPDEGFDIDDVRREFFLPDFFVRDEDVARAGRSHPVADIAFPRTNDQNVMLLAERGGVRNLGLEARAPFAHPHEARVLRYEIDASGVWKPAGRYDVGFYDRVTIDPPYLRANAAGGVDMGPGYDENGAADKSRGERSSSGRPAMHCVHRRDPVSIRPAANSPTAPKCTACRARRAMRSKWLYLTRHWSHTRPRVPPIHRLAPARPSWSTQTPT